MAEETGKTVELAALRAPARLPAGRDDLRDQLPGIEPERRVSDWGRSERVEGLVDRTLYQFLYHYWFRVEVEGVGNVPDQGGALLLANHAGALPPDGAMIAKAIREEHPHPRPVHLMTSSSLATSPALGMLLTKLGAVGAHPANLHRLLFDERELVLAFPEGAEGSRKALKERYRLRRFASAAPIEAAVRARVPIVPVAVVGAEEALPVVARLPRALRRIPRLPLATPLPLPAKLRVRFLEAVPTDELDPDAWRDRGFVEALAHEIRALIQENVLELVSSRRSVWLG